MRVAYRHRILCNESCFNLGVDDGLIKVWSHGGLELACITYSNFEHHRSTTTSHGFDTITMTSHSYFTDVLWLHFIPFPWRLTNCILQHDNTHLYIIAIVQQALQGIHTIPWTTRLPDLFLSMKSATCHNEKSFALGELLENVVFAYLILMTLSNELKWACFREGNKKIGQQVG